jgi:hypothetical protein
VSDTTFEGLTDWVTEKMTGNVKYFEGITAENLMKTFVFTIIGMKNVHAGKIAFQGMKNVPHYVNDLQDFLTKNREKYKIDQLSGDI